MSSAKFFGNKDDQSSDSDRDSSSEHEEEEKVEVQPARRNLYMESSSDEEEKRVVRSEKDKRFQAINDVIKKIKEKLKIEDFAAISDEFDELNKNMDKAKKIIEKEGVPRFYIRICYVLENYINNYPPEKKKNLKTANNKGFNALKSKLKKNNKNYVTQLEEFKKVPFSSKTSSKPL